MRELLKALYRRLPVVRDLQRIETILCHLHRDSQVLKAASIIQTLEAIKAGDPRYRDPKRLLFHGAQYWSQNYEDGMIAEIFRRIGTVNKTFLEIGVGDGSENNTTALLAAGWNGWWIEGGEPCFQAIHRRLEEMPGIAARLKVRQAFVSPDNICGLLNDMVVPSEVDLFSLDIDLDTYHIWAALKTFKPRVVVVEYNAGIPPNQVWIHPYHANRHWDETQAFGASLKAYENLGREFGYCLVGCDLIGANAFFVKDNLLSDRFAAPYTAENHYEPPRYQLSCRLGHPSKFYGEPQVMI
jgi:hypothetical protein